MSARTVFTIANLFFLMFTLQNCADKGGTLEVSVDSSSLGQPQPLPGATPGPLPAPAPAPGPFPAPAPGGVGANPMPLGLKATFRGGNVFTAGNNLLPLDLNMTPPQKIEVDFATQDTAYLSNPVNAVPNVDYVPFTGQTVTFNAGSTTANLNLQIITFTGKFFLFNAANCKYGGVPFSCVYLF